VVEDAGISISYQPGAVFLAKDTNPSVVRLLEAMSIIDTTDSSPSQGVVVTQGQQGPVGPTGPTGPQGPPGGLPAALAIDNSTTGLDIEITDADNIVGQSDGGWDIGSPDSGTTPLRPATIYVQTEVDVVGTTLGAAALTGAGALLVTSGPDTNLNVTAGAATPTSGNDGGDLVLTAGAKDGAGADGKIELRGNFANPLVMDVDGAVNLYDAAANKVVELLADPGALRVGRNTQLTAAEGDFVFGNDGTLTGTQTGLLLWDASAIELGVRDNANLRMIDIDGAANEVAIYEATGVRGLKVTTNGGVAEFRAEDATFRSGVDTVLPTLVRGGNSEGTENGGQLTLEAGRALGSGSDAGLLFRTGGMDRWSLDLNGHLLASADNGYNIGALGASRPLRVYVGTEVVVGNTITIGTDTVTASANLNFDITGSFNVTSPVATSGGGSAWSWALQKGEPGVAGVSPTAAGGGGAWTAVAGTGGDATGTAVGGETGGDAGVGGFFRLTGGPGGAGQAGAVDPGQPAVGGPLELFGGPCGAGAGTSDNANGANVIIRGGVAGTGGSGAPAVDGDVVIGDTATENVAVGALTVTNTDLIGSITTVNGGVSIGFETGGGPKWDIPTAGHFLAAVDNTHDIGASGATRPRSIYAGTSVDVASAHVFTGTTVGLFSATPVAQQADIVALTDSSGGAANDTVVAISGSGADSDINDNFADLTAKVNAMRALLQAYGLMA
jgi:hypothetical protein